MAFLLILAIYEFLIEKASESQSPRLSGVSGRRGSNSRPQPWQGCALPTELLPQISSKTPLLKIKARKSDRASSGRRWIRTTEGKNQQIYSLPHLATLVFSQNSFRTFEPMEGIEPTTPRLQITCSGQLSYIGNVVLFSVSDHISLTGLQR